MRANFKQIQIIPYYSLTKRAKRDIKNLSNLFGRFHSVLSEMGVFVMIELFVLLLTIFIIWGIME